MAFMLALDQGTTSSRAVLFDDEGKIRSIAQREFRQYYPEPGRVEHDPEEIWQSQFRVIEEALEKAKATAGDIAGIGITNQRETTLVWERGTGTPVHPAIVWQDRRTTDACNRIKAEGWEPLLRKKTGLVADPYFSGTKLKWVLDHVPGARKRAGRGELAFGTVDSWLVWNLTGGARHVTDPSNASRTLLYNIHTAKWDEELLALLDVPPEILPEVRPSSEVYAYTSPKILDSAIPISGIAGDQQAALFGQMCIRPGMVKNTYGTGCFLLMNTGEIAVESANNLLTTVAWQLGEHLHYALEGSVFIAGAAVQWLRDGLGLIRSAGEIEALAASVPDTGGAYLVPAFAGLGAPHWDPYARGILAGLTRGTSKAHLARATLESIAYQVADVLDAMVSDARTTASELRVDGGAAANDLLMQFQSDISAVPLARPGTLETTALGAAYLAGLAVGYWKDPETLSAHWREEKRFLPGIDDARRQRLRNGWRKALDRSRSWTES